VSDLRVVVVGASTGLGRCLGVGLGQRGAKVALLARRESLLSDAANEAGPGSLAIRCDVTDESSCRDAIDEAVKGLGGVDAVIVVAGISELRRVEEIDAAAWHRMFGTNVVGASLITAAVLPHLKESSGMIAYLSSVSASLTAPWPGLASYTVTKAALDKLVEAWRAEHPEVGFTRLIVGECAGGEGDGTSQFTASWDLELAGELFAEWTARGLLTEKLMDVEHFISAVHALVQCGASVTIPTIAMTPRRPI
jgi:NAD(P)-dependent dehydrogenase (short-subunit alcohol dehydrogenase family)